MNAIIKPGSPVLFMKIGIHAREPLEEIIKRKLQEVDKAGMAFWGYGGSTCHPRTMVQPFATLSEAEGKPIHLVMQKMESNHWAEPVAADEYSVDGQNWLAIPRGIRVLGSRYALVIEDLKEADFQLPLARTRVALGPSTGKIGRDYIMGRVDKACLELGPESDIPVAPEESTPIGLVAKLKQPYAVFLRNKLA
ncbi:MAG: hypothetical protein LKM39_14510 [Chiayiivirga sp.]|nr:hypothetical protein [Chiayiivirga sp.]